MGVLNVAASFEPRIRLQRICFGDADAWFAGNGVFAAGDSYKGATSHRGRFGESDFREIAGAAGQREILAQWKIGIAVPHQDPAQIGMTTEADAHHIVDLAFMPIRRAPNGGDRWQFSFLLAYGSLETEILQMTVAIEMIDQREARIVAVIVNAGDVDQVIKA